MTLHDSANDLKANEVRLDRMLGRTVLTGNNRSAGRVEEFRAELHGTGCAITGVVIGPAGMLERLDVGVRLLFGRALSGYVARWDQMDFSDPETPRLKCRVEELQKL
jgi:hypothetical protein